MDMVKTNMKTLILMVLTTMLYSDSYSNLRNYKENHPSIQQEKKEGDFIIRFKNINKFNFDKFEKTYNVEFKFCIADGICVFKPVVKNTINETLLKMREREDLLSVDIYKKYNMKTY